jgi:hypothetical protein
MAIGTVRNYVKSIKLFCEMADMSDNPLPMPFFLFFGGGQCQ